MIYLKVKNKVIQSNLNVIIRMEIIPWISNFHNIAIKLLLKIIYMNIVGKLLLNLNYKTFIGKVRTSALSTD